MTAAEFWDVLDADGVPKGDTYARGAPGWPDGLFHLVVAVCVGRRDGSVLMTRRAAAKEFPLCWEFPGGSALAGESSRDAAVRELREETGLAVDAAALTLVGRFTEASALFDFYVLEAAVHDPELRLQAPEVIAAEWVPTCQVAERDRAGLMAPPWTARLAALWPRALRAMGAASGPCPAGS